MPKKNSGISFPKLPPEDQPLYASQLMQVLVDRMAVEGDFEVSWDYLKNGNGTLEANPAKDAALEAFSQGGNYAKVPGAMADHNPYPEGSPEAEAWGDGFNQGA